MDNIVFSFAVSEDSEQKIMWCTNVHNTTVENTSELGETIQVRGCLGRLRRLQPSKFRQKQVEKLTAKAAVPPVRIAKPSAAVLPSPQQNHGENKENIIPIINMQFSGAASGRTSRSRNKSKQSSIRGKDF